MYRKIRIQCIYLALLVILGVSSTSCSVYNKYRTAWFSNDGRTAKSFAESQASGDNRKVEKVEDVKPDAIQPKDGNSGKSAGTDSSIVSPEDTGSSVVSSVVSGGNFGQKKPLLDHYQELLVQMLEDEKVIKQFKKKQDELGTIVESLKANIEGFKVRFKEEEVKFKALEEKDKELVIKYANDSKALKAREKVYVDEIQELKMQLVKFQIGGIKTKQELVRVKTQYVMDRKKWAQ